MMVLLEITKKYNKIMILKYKEFLAEKANVEKADPCWNGYNQIGTKNLNGKIVPNCVRIKPKKK